MLGITAKFNHAKILKLLPTQNGLDALQAIHCSFNFTKGLILNCINEVNANNSFTITTIAQT